MIILKSIQDNPQGKEVETWTKLEAIYTKDGSRK